MATFVNLPSESWRAIIRRKGRYISETFKFRDDARRWATAQESAIDKGAAPKKTHIANKTTFAHLIDLHLADLREVGKPIGRTKLDTLLLLRRAIGQRRFAEFDRKFIIGAGFQAVGLICRIEAPLQPTGVRQATLEV